MVRIFASAAQLTSLQRVTSLFYSLLIDKKCIFSLAINNLLTCVFVADMIHSIPDLFAHVLHLKYVFYFVPFVYHRITIVLFVVKIIESLCMAFSFPFYFSLNTICSFM